MALASIYRIEFITPSGVTYRLLDYGDEMENDLELGTTQQSGQYAANGAFWGFGYATGGVRRSISWSRTLDHASRSVSRTYCQAHPSMLPYNVQGKLRISIENGPVFDHLSAVLNSASPAPRMDTARFETTCTYQASAGKTVPVSALPLTPGLPISWLLPPIGTLTTPIGSL